MEDGKRFTLKVLPVTPLAATEKIVKELITYAQQFVSLRVVLLDRGFYSNEVIKQIKKAEVKFVMPAKKYPKIKEQMQTVYKNGPITYEIKRRNVYITGGER